VSVDPPDERGGNPPVGPSDSGPGGPPDSGPGGPPAHPPDGVGGGSGPLLGIPRRRRRTTSTDATGRSGARRGETFWGWVRMTARLWGFFAFILLILIAFRQVILPFILALLVTYVLHPVLAYLSGKQLFGRLVPRVVWLIALYVVLIGLSTLFVTSFVPRLSEDVKRIWSERYELVHKVKSSWLPAVSGWVERNFAITEADGQLTSEQGDPTSTKLRLRPLPDGTLELDPQGMRVEVVREEEGRWIVRTPTASAQRSRTQRFEQAIGLYLEELLVKSKSRVDQLLMLGQRFVVGLLELITTFILVLMISAFLLMDTNRILSWMRNLVPQPYHHDFDTVVGLIDKALGGAIRGQLLICLVNGVLTGIGLMLLQVKYALLLALLAGVMSLIPIFGSILSTVPIVTVALVSGEHGVQVGKGLLVLGWIVGIHLVEANLLNPKIIGTAAKIHPVIVIFSVVAGQRTYGAAGALLAVPIVSAVQTMFVYIRAKVRGEVGPAPPRANPAQATGAESPPGNAAG
jgi:predicted PurR-regulated permease PerM